MVHRLAIVRACACVLLASVLAPRAVGAEDLPRFSADVGADARSPAEATPPLSNTPAPDAEESTGVMALAAGDAPATAPPTNLACTMKWAAVPAAIGICVGTGGVGCVIAPLVGGLMWYLTHKAACQ